MIHTFSQYVERTNETAVYPSGIIGKHYVALGLVGEVGEVANKVKKIIRGDIKLGLKIPDDMEDGISKTKLIADIEKANKFVEDISGEVGDIAWYLAQASKNLNIKITKIVHTNIIGNYVNEAMGPKPIEDDLKILSVFVLQLMNEAIELAGFLLSSAKDYNKENVKVCLSRNFSFIAAISKYLKLDLEQILNHNIEKLSDRKKRGVIKGSGDKR